MTQFTMKLDKKHQRPVVVLKNGLTALVDTGAYIPVCILLPTMTLMLLLI